MIQKISDSFFSLVDAYMHAHYGVWKKAFLEDHPNLIVEIGAGYGANFRYMRKGTEVIAIEPKEALHAVLRRRAAKFDIKLEIYPGRAENMQIEDNSVELVLSSLVLCSVEEPQKVISEIQRILKPNGRFVYIEHVKAQEHSWICRIQKMIKKPWKWVFDGCNVTRDTSATIQEANFSKVDETRFSNRTVFIPIIPHIAGVAIK